MNYHYVNAGVNLELSSTQVYISFIPSPYVIQLHLPEEAKAKPALRRADRGDFTVLVRGGGSAD